jgi:hypothetical protein
MYYINNESCNMIESYDFVYDFFTGVQYASVNLGIFLCENCVSVHQALGSHISRTKSLKKGPWEQSELQVCLHDNKAKHADI